MELSKDLYERINEFQAQTGIFRKLCEFVYYGVDYMNGDIGAQERLYAMLEVIKQEAKRIEDISDEIFNDMARTGIWQRV